MNVGRGLLRLGLAIIAVWFAFCTYAYILSPVEVQPGSVAELLALFKDRRLMVPCLALAVLLGVWAVAGFRSGYSRTKL